MDLIDIFRTFHPNVEEYTFSSSAHGTFSGIDHILDHKSSLTKFKKIEIISSIFDHNTMRLDINYRKKKKTTWTPIFTAALFTISRTWKPPRCPSTDEWIKKLWYIYTMEYYSTIKRTHLSQF